MSGQNAEHYDVVVLGAGLAGLTLARQLLLYSEKRVLLLDRRAEIPPPRQKVGESSVQLGAYYYSKVLDMEEHLLREHYMKYNLRFYWKTAGAENVRFEEYSQAYIKNFSNIACYQLDRNKFEGELLRLNLQSPRFTFLAPATELDVALAAGGPHSLAFQYAGSRRTVEASWVVDASGRSKFLARRHGLRHENPIRHGTSFLWVDGLVDIDKLTDLSPAELRLKPSRRATGHLPTWLATNHFMGEGFWFWVIPLQGKTSLGLVYDNRLIAHEEVWTSEKLMDWICREFPLFEADLRRRRILDHSTIRDFSYDCVQTISAQRWALSGEAGRFTDPLYSPGSDLISMHNTLIADAILTDDPAELSRKARLYEQLMRAFYQATVPTYATSYDTLGDQEAFVLKYVWELSVYFSYYVFPFINNLFTDRQFIPGYLNRFARLGAINRCVQTWLSGYYQWKKRNAAPQSEPVFYDFTAFETLRAAERMFYQVGVAPAEAHALLDRQYAGLQELAQFVLAYLSARVLGRPEILESHDFIANIVSDAFQFDVAAIEERWRRTKDNGRRFQWSFDPTVMDVFRPAAALAGAAT